MKIKILFFILIPFISFCQNSSDLRMENDSDGNIIMYSYYAGSMSLDNIVVGDSISLANFVVSKIDTSGNVIWAQEIDIDAPDCIGFTCPKIGFEVDNEGNTVLLIKFFSFSIDGLYYDDYDSFALMKISPEGDIVWHKVISGKAASNSKPQLAISNDLDIYIAFHYYEDISVDTVVLETNQPTFGILKFSPDGEFIEGNDFDFTNIGGTRIEVSSLQIDAFDNLYAGGLFISDLEVNGTIFEEDAGSSPFICKFNSSGEVSWFNGFFETSTFFNTVGECQLDENETTLVVSATFVDTLFLSPAVFVEDSPALFHSILAGFDTNTGELFWHKKTRKGFGIDVNHERIGLLSNEPINFIYDTLSVLLPDTVGSTIAIIDDALELDCILYHSNTLQDFVFYDTNIYSFSNGIYSVNDSVATSFISLKKMNYLTCEEVWEKKFYSELTLFVSTNDIPAKDEVIHLFPNPAADYFTIKNLPQNGQITVGIYDMNRKQVQIGDHYFEKELSIDIPTDLTNGLYWVSISNSNFSIQKKLIVVK